MLECYALQFAMYAPLLLPILPSAGSAVLSSQDPRNAAVLGRVLLQL